jgi:hypothetical protein
VPALCIRILNRWQKAKTAYCLGNYEQPADLKEALGRKDNATVARLAAAARADETALLCLILCLRPRLLRLATTPRYEHLDVNLQTILWQVLERPLATLCAADEIEGRIKSKLVPMWRKAARRRQLAPTDSLSSGADDDKAPEIPAPARDDLDLRLDMEATVERLPPGQRQLVIASAVFGFTEGDLAGEMGVGVEAAKKAKQRATAKAREEYEKPRPKRR